MRALRIALPNGVLLPDACALLESAGVARLDPASFTKSLRVADHGNDFVMLRPTDVPVYVELGACECGIVGKDVLWETERECYELVDLGFGTCRLVLAAPADSPLAAGVWPPSLRVATKYPRAANRFLHRLGVAAELIKLHGSVELAPATGLADAVCDLTATGRTLRANHLVEIADAGTSTARLIANQAALKTRDIDINALATALRRAVGSRAAAKGAA